MSAHSPGYPPPKRGHKAGWQDEQKPPERNQAKMHGGTHHRKIYRTELMFLLVTAHSHPPTFQGEGGCHK